MKGRTIYVCVFLCLAIILLAASKASAQTFFLDRKLSVLVKFDEYLVFREDRHRSQKVRFGQRLTMWRHRVQTELYYKAYEDDETSVNFFLWLQYFYESGPDINKKIKRAMSAGQRHRDYQVPRWDSDDFMHEAYVDLNRGPWQIRLGKQKVVWGEMQLQRTTDIINPLDLRYSSPGIDDFDELKIGIWMLRASYLSDLPGELMFEFIFNPGDYQQIRLGVQGSDRGAPSVPNEEMGGLGITGAIQELKNKSEPRFALKNYEFGFRVRGLYNTTIMGEHYEFLWTLMYFNTLDDSMIIDDVKEYNDWSGTFSVARGDFVTTPLPTKNIFDAKRFEMYGLGIQTYDNLFTRAVITTEIAYFSGIDFNKTERPGTRTLGKIERDFFTYGLSFARALPTPFIKKFFPKSQGWVNTDIAIFQGWYLGNVSRIKRRFSYNERSNTTFTLMFRTHFLNQTFTPVFRMLYNTRNWGYISLSCSVSLTTRFKFTVGLSENYSNNRDHDGIAAAYAKDRLYVKFKYAF